MNDQEREQWVMNDEGLYNWWKGERCGVTVFVRQNREELTKLIEAVINRPPAEKTWRDF